jgi:hypothetical protein
VQSVRAGACGYCGRRALLTLPRLPAGHWPDDATGVLACRCAVIRLTLRRSLPSTRHYAARAQAVARRAAIAAHVARKAPIARSDLPTSALRRGGASHEVLLPSAFAGLRCAVRAGHARTIPPRRFAVCRPTSINGLRPRGIFALAIQKSLFEGFRSLNHRPLRVIRRR